MKRGMYHLQAHPSLTIIMLDFGKSPSIPGQVKTVLLDKLWIFQIPDITKERCPQLRNIVPLTIIMLDFEKTPIISGQSKTAPPDKMILQSVQ